MNDPDTNRPPLPPAALGSGFDAILGQAPIVQALRHAISSGRLPHALLFGGPQGVGKATCAGILAQALNCAVAGPDDACGHCPSCSKIARGIHPDVLRLAPDPRQIRIGQVRHLVREVAYRPHEGQRRVMMIDQAQCLNAEAQNALLKTLEEPPASSLLVLVSTAPAGLLPTVRSRCQSLRFAPLPQAAVQDALVRAWQLDPAEARLRAALAPGSLGAALAVDLQQYSEQLEAVVEALRLAQKGGAGVVAAAESLAALGKGDTAAQKALATLRVARDVLRDLLVVSAGGNLDTLVNIDRLEAWQQWARQLDPDAVTEALMAITDGIEYIGGPIVPNLRLAFERTLFQVHRALSGSVPAGV